ncbi:uncharacterized protein EV420DRAFT_1761961 [Desarmillaria tabescens]|uniref:Uncharacterized protein n=1 Tax=Armillaria tabescens TaxID=1929756 RepID=A0AA39N9Y4_ARMTA|nr:uncharacterized protein EV420DRAFT_1761961 [Desarmillaria tabescens]KAK0461752.1 hypothetical protein EV420DRAFT_1761961 [Desarmillaria tabescens]
MDSESSESSGQSTRSRSPSSTSSQSEHEVVVTEDTKQKFAREFRKRPNVHDLMQWKRYHNSLVCKNCLLRGQDCTPKDNSAVCISCEEQRVGCSRAELERTTRVRRLLNLSYQELEFLVDWYKGWRETKGSIIRKTRTPITPSPRKTKFQDSPILSPEFQAKTARARRHEPEEQYASSSSSASQILNSSPGAIYEHDPTDHATAANFQQMWNDYMNNCHSPSPQTPSGAGGAVLDVVTGPEHSDTGTQNLNDLLMLNYECLETSTERADVLFDEANPEAPTEVQNPEGSSTVMPADKNQAALTHIELLLHRNEVENVAARVKAGDITQQNLLNALKAISEGLLGMAMKYDAASESAGRASVGGSSEWLEE